MIPYPALSAVICLLDHGWFLLFGQHTNNVYQIFDTNDLNVLRYIERLAHAACGQKDLRKAKTGSLLDAIIDVRNSAHLARKAKLAKGDQAWGYESIGNAGKQCQGNRKVGCRLVHTHTAYDIEIGIKI